MQIKNNNKLSLKESLFFYFIYFIILVKCLFFFFALWNLYLENKDGRGRSNDSDSDSETKLKKRVQYYKIVTEDIFIVLVSLLLIYLFNPYHNNKYLDSKYVKAVFFIYGLLMLITFDWSEFVRNTS
uniref:Uncharacterized protein n=1 Tax=viral metagenome TaxID=1070528 RepID=A0A6C0E802_9ZZZZ